MRRPDIIPNKKTKVGAEQVQQPNAYGVEQEQPFVLHQPDAGKPVQNAHENGPELLNEINMQVPPEYKAQHKDDYHQHRQYDADAGVRKFAGLVLKNGSNGIPGVRAYYVKLQQYGGAAHNDEA